MSAIDGIVKVNVTPGTAGVTAKAFGVGLILGESKAFLTATVDKWRVREYSSLAAVGKDYLSTNPEYLMASRYFGQNPTPEKLLIGQKWNSETASDTLTAITFENAAWYILTVTSRVAATIKSASDWVQSDNTRVFITASAEPSILVSKTGGTPDATSIWFLTKANDRTLIIAYSLSATEYPDGALAGLVAVFKPGEYTLKFKNLRGIVEDKYTDTQKGNAWDKGVNTYSDVGGRAIIENGKTNFSTGDRDTGGEWFDIIVFCDWIRARVAEGVYRVFINAKKVPYTEVGVAMLQAPVTAVLLAGQDNGGISPHEFDTDGVRVGGFSITAKMPSEMDVTKKQQRKYDGISGVAFLAGAIHYSAIDITVTY